MSTLKINKLERQVKKLEKVIEGQKTIIRLETEVRAAESEQINQHWQIKFDMIVSMFEAQLNEEIETAPGHFRPQTLGEFKKWFSEWTDDVSSLNANDSECGEKVADIIDKHGFSFYTPKTMGVTHKEVLGRD